jgi:copper homeostasis protein (lipoprotein)
MRQAFFLLMIFILASCNTNKNGIASTDSSYKTIVSKTPVVNAENYVGTLPCADCKGIDVSLQLNHDSTYIMNSFYRGARGNSTNNHFADIGKWVLNADALYLSAKNHTTKYIKTDTTLMQLDDDEKIITGPLAAMFVT